MLLISSLILSSCFLSSCFLSGYFPANISSNFSASVLLSTSPTSTGSTGGATEETGSTGATEETGSTGTSFCRGAGSKGILVAVSCATLPTSSVGEQEVKVY